MFLPRKKDRELEQIRRENGWKLWGNEVENSPG
jgi:hypothetical protein